MRSMSGRCTSVSMSRTRLRWSRAGVSVWALSTLAYKVRGLRVRDVVGGMWKMLLAAVLMAEAMWLLSDRIDSDVGWTGLVEVVAGGSVGLLVYASVLLALRAEEMSWLRRRFARSG